jgi:hypothetical protein
VLFVTRTYGHHANNLKIGVSSLADAKAINFRQQPSFSSDVDKLRTIVGYKANLVSVDSCDNFQSTTDVISVCTGCCRRSSSRTQRRPHTTDVSRPHTIDVSSSVQRSHEGRSTVDCKGPERAVKRTADVRGRKRHKTWCKIESWRQVSS